MTLTKLLHVEKHVVRGIDLRVRPCSIVWGDVGNISSDKSRRSDPPSRSLPVEVAPHFPLISNATAWGRKIRLEKGRFGENDGEFVEQGERDVGTLNEVENDARNLVNLFRVVWDDADVRLVPISTPTMTNVDVTIKLCDGAFASEIVEGLASSSKVWERCVGDASAVGGARDDTMREQVLAGRIDMRERVVLEDHASEFSRKIAEVIRWLSVWLGARHGDVAVQTDQSG